MARTIIIVCQESQRNDGIGGEYEKILEVCEAIFAGIYHWTASYDRGSGRGSGIAQTYGKYY